MKNKDFKIKRDRRMDDDHDFAPSAHKKPKLKPPPKEKYRLRSLGFQDDDE